MSEGQNDSREPIAELLARLIEDARALAKTELALFRTDFYRRIGRARTGALLLLIGAIMGQAAAVTFLVTLSFVLTPWIGRLGGAAVSVALGVAMAVVMIRIGVKKLLLVVEDYEDEDQDGESDDRNALDELFERMRARSREARRQLVDTVDETQARLHPQALLADLVDEVIDYAQVMSHRAVDAMQRRPFRTAAAGLAVLLLLLGPPIYQITALFRRATRRSDASYRDRDGARPAIPHDEETSA